MWVEVVDMDGGSGVTVIGTEVIRVDDAIHKKPSKTYLLWYGLIEKGKIEVPISFSRPYLLWLEWY